MGKIKTITKFVLIRTEWWNVYFSIHKFCSNTESTTITTGHQQQGSRITCTAILQNSAAVPSVIQRVYRLDISVVVDSLFLHCYRMCPALQQLLIKNNGIKLQMIKNLDPLNCCQGKRSLGGTVFTCICKFCKARQKYANNFF